MRAVHEEQVHEEEHQNEVKKAYYPKREGKEGIITSLTVWRKSLVISCKGFTVIDSEGKLVYRVDNYMGRPQDITLMDASGKSVLTMRRRTRVLSLSLSLSHTHTHTHTHIYIHTHINTRANAYLHICKYLLIRHL